MEQNASFSAHRQPGHEHIPVYPKGFVAIRILQLVLGLAALGLTAYLLAVLPISYAGDDLMIFTSVVNLIIDIYYIVAAFGPRNIYNYWAVVALDIFLLIFWLISFAILASEAADVFSVINALSSYNSYYCEEYDECGGDYYGEAGDKTYAGIMAGAAGVGAMLFILYIVSLSIHSVALHRHRAAGLHSMPGARSASAAPAAGMAGAGGATLASEKAEPTTNVHSTYPSGVPSYHTQTQQQQQQPIYAAQQPTYAQQGPVQGHMAEHVSPMNAYPPPQQAASPISAQHTGGTGMYSSAAYPVPSPQQGSHQLSSEPAYHGGPQ